MSDSSKNCPEKTGQTLSRNRYFDGKVLTADDFSDEQAYFLSRRWLHNRLLHGYGTVCGLNVMQHFQTELANHVVIVTAGAAIDGCGRELLLLTDTPVAVWDKAEAPDAPDPQLLALRYCELPERFVPAALGPGADNELEASRIREQADIVLLPLAEVDPRCWQGSYAPCLEEECPCGGLVPLAVIVFEGQGVGPVNLQIDSSYRRQIGSYPPQHTQIEWINWPHGGEMPVGRFRSEHGRRLMVRFSDQLRSASRGSGINPMTFQVQLVSRQGKTEHVEGRAWLLDDRQTAVFAIAGSQFDSTWNIIGETVMVTLKCDFIIDHRGFAVDGNHLGGQLPTGNGSAGGDFTSWFRLVE